MPFVNKNKSYSFNINVTTSLVGLSAFEASEVLINNKSGQVINIFDNERNGADQAFQLDDNDSIVLRGITNTSNVSAQTTSGNGTVYFRSAYFSNLNQF
jgi:hypothetical protein